MIVFSWGKIMKKEGLDVLDKKTKSLDLDLNESYKLWECGQTEAIKVNIAYRRVS